MTEITITTIYTKYGHVFTGIVDNCSDHYTLREVIIYTAFHLTTYQTTGKIVIINRENIDALEIFTIPEYYSEGFNNTTGVN